MIRNINDTVELYNGVKMPGLGFGVWQISEGDTAESVKLAIKNGYRNIDTAAAYHNEKEVGYGIRARSATAQGASGGSGSSRTAWHE